MERVSARHLDGADLSEMNRDNMGTGVSVPPRVCKVSEVGREGLEKARGALAGVLSG